MRYRNPIFMSIKEIDTFASALCDENDLFLEQRDEFLDCLIEIYERIQELSSHNILDLIRETVEKELKRPLEEIIKEIEISKKPLK